MSGKVVVVGSFVVGITVRLPRFPLPGETLPADAFDSGPGGKGTNVAVGVTRLGGEVDLIVKIGSDDFGLNAERLFVQEGIRIDHVFRSETESTGVGLVYIDGGNGENTIGLHLGANLALTEAEVVSALETSQDATVLTAQLEVRDEVVEAALDVAANKELIRLLNPAPARELSRKILQKTNVITPNRVELFQLLGMDVPAAPDDRAIAKAASELIQLGPSTVVVTLGSQGAYVLDAIHGEVWLEPLMTEPVDTVGAGDAFNAGLAWGLAAGKDVIAAARIGTVCGALATRKMGVINALPFLSDVEEQLQ